MLSQVRLVIPVLVALFAATLVPPTLVRACDDCDRDGSRHVLVEGEFVRYHRVRFELSIRIHEGERDWVDTVDVVPMALPMKDGEPISWSSLNEGDVIEANIRETERERVVTSVTVVRTVERETSTE